MFQRILVPLDGSERAESALPVAANIARATGGSLLFVRVVSLPTEYALYVTEPFGLPQEIPATECQTATAYLTRKKQAPEFEGIPIQTRLLVGMPAQQILSCMETQAIDLVVMCSRGETGLKRRVWGSVAQKVLRHSHVPVVILHESAGPLGNQHPAGLRPVRVLVALDESSLAEKALQPAAVLSEALSEPERGMLHLVHVLCIPERAHEAEERSAAFQLDLAVAQTRLRLTEESFLENAHNSAGCLIQASVVGERDIASGILRVAEDGIPATAEREARSACDVIALTTHGRSGPEHWVMGSIAERLLDGTRLPLLVVPSSWTTKPHLQDALATPASVTP